MSRMRINKDSEFSEEKLVGKSIVDPKGNIIAKCIGLIEDDKKRLHMKIAIITDINSEFIVDETIPVSNINRIGEVILLKKPIEIKQVPIEDIVTFEIPQEGDSSQSEEPSQEIIVDEDKLEDSIQEDKTENVDLVNSVKYSDTKNKLKSVTKGKLEDIISKKSTKVSKSDDKKGWSFQNEFDSIVDGENGLAKNEKVNDFISEINKNTRSKKTAIKHLIKNLSESNISTRLTAAYLLNKLSEKNTKHFVSFFKDSLISVYNEPSKEVENLLIKYLIRIATENKKELAKIKLNVFFDKLIVKRDICKSITKNRIHSLNMKIFVNNFDIQEIIICKYINNIIKNSNNTKEFALFLKDYNAILIAYSLIRTLEQNSWNDFLDSIIIKKSFNEPFRESIDRIIKNFLEGNIKALSEIIDPKLGFNYSNKVITNMIKSRIDDFLANVSILPLDVLTAFFKDDQKRAIQIIFDLINRNEISAQIVFIEDKTYISPL
ncbi:MAG: hypothetical protein FK730_16450 [Asgard group archaeon]|nr:hypothetical protein [Asgard group archaeon]